MLVALCFPLVLPALLLVPLQLALLWQLLALLLILPVLLYFFRFLR